MKLNFYQNIRLFPDEETGAKEIGEVLFLQLHLAFVENKDLGGNSRYAVSFPEYSKGGGKGSFGRLFRVFASTKEDLSALDLPRICNRLSGYAECTGIAPVPKAYSFLRFFRVQGKSNAEALARRMSRRKGIPLEEAKETYRDFKPAMLNLPYINIKSFSTKQTFSLSINCVCEAEERDGTFTLYGLSSGGNVPDF